MVLSSVRWVLIIFFIMTSCKVFANQILDPIKNSISLTTITRGKFIQNRILTGVTKKLTSEGYFLVDRNRGILWITEKPIYQVLVVTNSGITIRNKSKTLMSLNSRNDPSLRYVNELILSIFSGEIDSLDKIFEPSVEIFSKEWVLDLIPKNVGSNLFKKVSIAGSTVISRITFTSRDGDVTDITFIEVRPDNSVTNDEIIQFQ
jgi:outer membrane lipoprotein-sorting protein